MKSTLSRAESFCARFGLRVPILLAPMAGASAPSLSIAVADAGGLGACGVVQMQPDDITAWAAEVRAATQGPFQLNNWISDPAPKRDRQHEAQLRAFLERWGPAVPEEAGDATPPDFGAQCEAILAANPPIVSSVMGLFPPQFVAQLKRRGIVWFANISTTSEARAAEAAGADVIVAQGAEAGGHRGCFDAAEAERQLIGSFALIPTVVDAVKLPVVATGGIADARGVAAALTLGASAVQVGTGFLRCPEAQIHRAWADALARTLPEDTMITRAYSGRAGRSIATDFVRAAAADDAPAPAPYPVQRGLTELMKKAARSANDVQRMQAWSGQAATLASGQPAAQYLQTLWEGAQRLLG